MVRERSERKRTRTAHYLCGHKKAAEVEKAWGVLAGLTTLSTGHPVFS